MCASGGLKRISYEKWAPKISHDLTWQRFAKNPPWVALIPQYSKLQRFLRIFAVQPLRSTAVSWKDAFRTVWNCQMCCSSICPRQASDASMICGMKEHHGQLNQRFEDRMQWFDVGGWVLLHVHNASLLGRLPDPEWASNPKRVERFRWRNVLAWPRTSGCHKVYRIGFVFQAFCFESFLFYFCRIKRWAKTTLGQTAHSLHCRPWCRSTAWR